MNIYIPSHLRKLEVVDQMCKMISEYENYFTDPIDSFDDYYYYLKNDPVGKFLNICIPENSIPVDQDYGAVINYLSRLFYSVKGSIKVFEYMKKYLNLNFEGDIIYTTKYIEFRLSGNQVSDEKIFYQSLYEFLEALLYFQDLRVITDRTELELTGNIKNYIGTKITNYNNFIAEPYEIEYK